MTSTPATPNKPRTPRTLDGEVVRRSGDKTVAVAVHHVKMHPRYHKRSNVTQTYLAHDPNNSAEIGEKVQIREHRPISRRKRWIIVPVSPKE